MICPHCAATTIKKRVRGLLVLRYLHGPKNLETVLIITTVSGIIMVVTTWWWKISIHAATLAGTLTILTALYGVIILPAFALLGLVSWSRVCCAATQSLK